MTLAIGRPNQEISEGITRTVEAIDIAISQNSLNVTSIGAGCRVNFILLTYRELNSELQRMLADGLTHIVAHTVGRIGVAPWHIRGVDGKSIPTICCICPSYHDTRKLASEPVVEQDAHGTLRVTRY